MWRKNSKVWILTAIFMCTAVPALAASTLTVGSRGDEVRSVQQGLRSKGYKVNVNGVYTKETAQAVSKYQKDKKIQVSGKVGGWTYYLLTGNRSMLPPKPVMKRGQGDALQQWRYQQIPSFQRRRCFRQSAGQFGIPVFGHPLRIWRQYAG